MNKFIKILIIIGLLGLIAIISYKTYFYIKKDNENKFDLGNITKEEVFSLIDKGSKEISNIKVFMYSRELFDDDSLAPIFVEDEYNGLLNYIDFFQYKDEKYNFSTLRHKDDFVWGYFLEEGKEPEEKIYIVIDKKSGQLKALNKNTMQVIVY